MKKTSFMLVVVLLAVVLLIGQAWAQLNPEEYKYVGDGQLELCPHYLYTYGVEDDGRLVISMLHAPTWRSGSETSPIVVQSWLNILLQSRNIENSVFVVYDKFSFTIKGVFTYPIVRKGTCSKK